MSYKNESLTLMQRCAYLINRVLSGTSSDRHNVSVGQSVDLMLLTYEFGRRKGMSTSQDDTGYLKRIRSIRTHDELRNCVNTILSEDTSDCLKACVKALEKLQNNYRSRLFS